MERKKSMEIATFKVKSRIPSTLTFNHFDLTIFSYRCPFDANLILFDSWLENLSSYQISVKNKLIWERYDFFKMTYKFCQHTGFMKKQVQIASQSIQTDIQVFISAI
jgi:flavodoxin